MAEHSIVIVGAGGIGCASAAYLVGSGYRPAMWSPNGTRMQRSGNAAHFTCTGALSTTVDVTLLQSAEELANFDVVLICLPGNAYGEVLAPLADHWRSGQTLIVSGSLSLCPLWLADEARMRGRTVQAAGWGTTAATAHFQSDGTLRVNPLRNRIDVAAINASEQTQPAIDICEQLFGPRFAVADNLLASALANINPIAHAAEVIPNLTRMDKGETWPLFGNFTPVVARLADRLDRERLAIAEAFGFSLPSLQQHYGASYHLPPAALETMAAEIDRRGMGPNGPNRLDHRYVLEDAPYGLVFMEALAGMAGVDAPALSSSITLLETVYGRDFRGANFLVRALGLADTDASALRMRCAAASSAATVSRRTPAAR
jgi:opine dehydrogenase